MKYIHYPLKEFKLKLYRNRLQCKMTIGKTLELIQQVKFHQQYCLKIHVNSPYTVGIIGKKRQFLQQIKYFSGEDVVKVFATRHYTQNSEMIVM